MERERERERELCQYVLVSCTGKMRQNGNREIHRKQLKRGGGAVFVILILR
jgi:hypothetical protein